MVPFFRFVIDRCPWNNNAVIRAHFVIALAVYVIVVKFVLPPQAGSEAELAKRQ